MAFNKRAFLAKVKATVKRKGFCVIVVSEGARYANGSFLGESGAAKDAFGHAQLGGVAPTIANMIKDALGFKYHWAVADYLQRSRAIWRRQPMWSKRMLWARQPWNSPLQARRQ